MQKDLASATR